MRATLLSSFALCVLFVGALSPRPRDTRRAAPEPRQETACALCPTITVECPETVNSPGTPITFTAKISGAGPSPSLTLNWTVSAGTIASGRDTTVTTPDSVNVITVDTTGLSGNTTVAATVEVSGLDRSCANAASCSTGVNGIFDPHPIDVYGDIKFEYEQARLDNFAITLQETPEFAGYVICYGGRKGARGEAKARCERAKKYLTERRNIDPARLLTFDGGFQETMAVWLWLLPPGLDPPLSPTVDPSEVQFTDGARKRRGRAPRRPRPRS